MKFFQEKLYSHYKQNILVNSKIIRKKSKFQDIFIFHSKIFGKVLCLDGIIQITENDHYGYSEMLAHVPMMAHANAKRILIIGGGDGAIANEILKYSFVKEIIICEIDEEVIKLCKKYLNNINHGSLNNKKVNIVFKDASKFVKNNKYINYFDLIIVDRPDPIGPGKSLYLKSFYKNLNKIIKANGIIVFQNGVPFFQKTELRQTINKFKDIFNFNGVYLTVVPTYTGGYMALSWASNKIKLSNKKINKNLLSNLDTKYYGENIHYSSFKLPKWIQKIIT